jgi:dihydrodipicolinate synthase/N-acetylneuraminate lyase
VSGVYAALITPRRAGGHEVDLSALFDLIDLVASGPVDGIAMLTGAGSFMHFDFGTRTRMVELGIRRSRVPVLVNVTHSTLDGSIQLGQEAFYAGAAGVLVTPPFGFRYAQPEIREYCGYIAASLGRVGPLFLFDDPALDNHLDPATIEAVMSSDMFSGLAVAADAPVRGAAVAISTVAGVAPKQAAAGQGAELHAWLERFPCPVALHEAAALRGIHSGAPAIALSAERQALLEEFRRWFKDWIK